jgi:predicted RNA-binding Zn-ribbon protein involved in translation (DUF1610 family)
MALAYIPYVILLAISPIIGELSLKYVYPDIKTFVKSKKWALFVAYGLLAYVTAAVIALYELVVPLYSPFGRTPLLFESEGNAFFMLGMLLASSVVYSSVIDFIVVRRKRTIIGLPKSVISYGIRKEIAEVQKARKRVEIARITTDLEGMAGREDGIKDLLEKIRVAVVEERKKASEKVLLNVAEEGKKEDVQRKFVEVLESPGELQELINKVEKHSGNLEKLEELVEIPDAHIAEKAVSMRGEEAGEGAEAEMKAREERIGKAKERLKEVLAKRNERVAATSKLEKETLMDQLERKLKGTAVESNKRERLQQLLADLKTKVQEEHEVPSGMLPSEDIAEIAISLKELKEEEREKEKKAETHHRHARERREGAEEELGESLVTYGRRYGAPGEEDVFKAVIGDVRDQLVEKKEEGKAKELPEKRWYEKAGGPAPAAKPEGMFPAGEASMGGEENVELFETELDFGKATGDLGLGEGLEGFGDLESLSENVESSEFDGMFVDVGPAKNACPNCGKKGTSVVYCSSCGKPLCSNCAKSVAGGDEFVKYKCPHCDEEFAMRKRLPA